MLPHANVNFKEINDAMAKIIEAAIHDNAREFDAGLTTYVEATQGEAVELCMNCADCLDYYFYSGLLVEIRDGHFNPQNAQRSIQAWKYATNADIAFQSLNNPSEPRIFNRKTFFTDKKIVYLDQNIVSLARTGDLKDTLIRIGSDRNLQFVYSPEHLEEAFKIKDDQLREKFLATLTSLTNQVSIQPGYENDMEFFIEDPLFSLRRVAATAEATKRVENNKILKDEDRSLYFEKYQQQEHRSAIANDPAVFENLSDSDFRELAAVAPSFWLEKSDYKGLVGRQEILHAIYTLHSILDLLGYKIETKEKKLEGGAHDVEHLIYGTRADFFVTNDLRLIARAKQIYSFIGIQVNVLTLDDFLAEKNTP